jgi:hypothetical protein
MEARIERIIQSNNESVITYIWGAHSEYEDGTTHNLTPNDISSWHQNIYKRQHASSF